MQSAIISHSVLSVNVRERENKLKVIFSCIFLIINYFHKYFWTFAIHSFINYIKLSIPEADSFWCLAKLIQCFRFKNKIKLKKKKKKLSYTCIHSPTRKQGDMGMFCITPQSGTLYVVGGFNGREWHSNPLIASLNGRINM